jgi:hypothetical protein
MPIDLDGHLLNSEFCSTKPFEKLTIPVSRRTGVIITLQIIATKIFIDLQHGRLEFRNAKRKMFVDCLLSGSGSSVKSSVITLNRSAGLEIHLGPNAADDRPGRAITAHVP